MALKEDIQNTMKSAMKERQVLKLAVIRMVWSAIRKLEIDSQRDIADDEVIGIIQKEIKSLDEALVFLKKDNRVDAINETVAKIAVLQAFLPEQLSFEEIKLEVMQVKESLKASGPEFMGKMMGVLVPKLRGRCDGKLLSQAVKEILSE